MKRLRVGLGIGLAAALVSAPMMRAQDDVVPAKVSNAFATKAGVGKVARPGVRRGPVKSVRTPLTERERAVQLVDRFTFGARPGDVDRVLAMGEDKWIDQQLNPGAIPDGAYQGRLQDYPTLQMTPEQILMTFPKRGQIKAVADGRMPYPTDPIWKAVYEVHVYRLQQEEAQQAANTAAVAKNGSAAGAVTAAAAPAVMVDADVQRQKDRARAMTIAGELLALPRNQRMAALMAMPVADRAVFTEEGNVTGEQRSTLMADFTPREREAIYSMASKNGGSRRTADELAEARMLRDVLSERQLQAVMTDFWFNHFNVYAPKESDEWYTTSYERDVIAKYALGNFRDLLLATAESPAMQVYLDNWLSIGPDSMANGMYPNAKGKRGSKGLNENYGREVMELHTVGVNGGYTQADVTALAAILTGWGVDQPQRGGPFQFDYKRHEPGPKVWFGYVIDDNGNATKLGPGVTAPAQTFGPSTTLATPDSMKQGIAALTILAESPQTAHFISYQLAQYFVADEPPASLVDRLQKVYLDSHGEIKMVLRALIASPEFNSRQYFRNKVKTPEEFVASSFRATATEPQNPQLMVNTVRNMGMELYHALPPTGYSLTADHWMNSVALVDRLNFAYQLTTNRLANQRFDAPKLLAMGLMTSTGAAQGGAGVRAVSDTAVPMRARLMGVSDATQGAPQLPAGTQVAMRVLESTMVGAPLSVQTRKLIEVQLAAEPAGTSATDTLNLLTALVMGSPEFQVR